METENDQSKLTLTDINAIKLIIEIASRRGAFEAVKLKEVGALYEKIVNFLEPYQTPKGE